MLEDCAGVDEHHDRQPDQRPDRPEIAAGRRSPDADEEQEEQG
jgi:hypothetical protein